MVDLTPAQVADLIKAKLHLVIYEAHEAHLMFAIWGQALVDAYRVAPQLYGHEEPQARTAIENRLKQIAQAREFVISGPPCLGFAGIDPDYAERVIRSVESCLPIEKRIYK